MKRDLRLLTFVKRGISFTIGALLTFSFFGNVSANTAYTGMRNISALQLTADMGTGWNLGNTLDATGGETSWGNPVTTQAMIDKVKAQGFKTIRIPTTWYPHLGSAPNYTIDAAWLNRVETVCNYAFANDMYVILNTHHEGSWCKPTYAQESNVKAQLVAIWTQVANRFKNYGDYLIFETLNEPRLEGSAEEWTGGTAEGRDVVNRLNKAAVDAIRATGGNNASRFIMCPTYAANGLGSAADAYVVPNNDSKVIVSVHNYSPYSFALQEPGTSTFGSSDRSVIDSEMGSYYSRWISAGRAVVIGEWGAIDKGNTSARISHATYFVQVAKSRQLPVVLWDNGYSGQYGFAQLNRTGLSWYYPDIVNAITSQFSGSCTPTAITPYLQVNGGSWQQTSSVTVASGATVKFGPQPASGGSWSWNGLASGTSREITINPTSSGTATATYTNTSGCKSTQVFTITISGGSTTTYVTIKNRATGLLIDGMGRTSAGSVCGQYASSGSWNQMWVLETSGSFVYIKNRNTGLYIDGRGNSTNGAYAGQWTSAASNNLQWQQETAGSYVKFKNRATGLYLDGMGNTSNGSDLGQWSNSSSYNQQWTITSLKSADVETVAIAENDKVNNVFIFPNPFYSSANLIISQPEQISRIVIVDMLGRQVEMINGADIKSSLIIGSSLKPGVYLLQVYGINWSKSFKIIKK